jgi:hypothetical protein
MNVIKYSDAAMQRTTLARTALLHGYSTSYGSFPNPGIFQVCGLSF